MTTTTDAITVTATSQKLDLEGNFEEFVANATWRELLMELVQTNKLDPWNIDLIKVVDGYIGIIKKMKVLDLHVPANIILAASVLLRLKSETLKVFEIEDLQPEAEMETVQRVLPEVVPLVPRMRLQPNKKVTLMELMNALDDVMKLKEKRELVAEEAATPLQFYISKEDIDDKMESLYAMVKKNVDKTGLTTFANMANKFQHIESILIELFIPLLFLAQRERVMIMQEKFFDEIFIKLDGKHD
jgi:segregation and condensation protein A